MACRCQERRAAIKAAARSGSPKKMREALRFVGRTAAQDLARAINIQKNNPTGKGR